MKADFSNVNDCSESFVKRCEEVFNDVQHELDDSYDAVTTFILEAEVDMSNRDDVKVLAALHNPVVRMDEYSEIPHPDSAYVEYIDSMVYRAQRDMAAKAVAHIRSMGLEKEADDLFGYLDLLY